MKTEMRLALVLLIAVSVVVGQTTLYYTAGACPSEMEADCNYNENNLNFECAVGDFNLKVVGNQNVPKYTIWAGSDPNTTYSFQLEKTYEATYKDGKLEKIGGTNIGMPSLNWVFSAVSVSLRNETVCDVYNATSNECVSNTTYCYAAAAFNITNNGEDSNGRWSSFVMVNHLGLGNESSLPSEEGYEYNETYNDEDDTNSTTNSVKIDFVITDYIWHDNEDDVYFGIECIFTQSNSGDDNGEEESLTVEEDDNDQVVSDGNGFFSVCNTANATLDGNSTTVTVTLTSSGNTLEIVYSHFEDGSTIVHDPSLGIRNLKVTTSDNDTADNDEPSDLTTLWIVLAVVGTIVVIGGVAAVVIGGVVYMRRRKAAYSSI